MNTPHSIGLLGFGEVGQVLAADLLARGFSRVSAWDLKFSDGASAPSRAISAVGIRNTNSAADLAHGNSIVISAVTAAQDVAAAESVVSHLDPGTYFFDLNSVSPGVKKRVAALVEQNGGRYVEGAVMSPIAPKRIASPILLGGPQARDFLPIAQELGFAGAEVFSSELGRASAAKMCRSVLIKGLEALLAESLITARHYGVEATVLDSLHNVLGRDDWAKLSQYMISRSIIHGLRRAEEMREVAQTVRDAGLTPSMSTACAERQEWAAAHRCAADARELNDMLDQLRANLRMEPSAC